MRTGGKVQKDRNGARRCRREVFDNRISTSAAIQKVAAVLCPCRQIERVVIRIPEDAVVPAAIENQIISVPALP